MSDVKTPTAPDPIAERDRVIDSQRQIIDELMSHTRRVISISHLVLARGMSDDLVSDLKSVEQRLRTADQNPSSVIGAKSPITVIPNGWKKDAVRLYNLGYSCGAISMYLNLGYGKIHYFLSRLPNYSKFKGNRKRTRMHRNSWITRRRLKSMSEGRPNQ